jgi:group I intron endonuclease
MTIWWGNRIARYCPGVYAIINTRTRRRYVGVTARSISRRWCFHRRDLDWGRHKRQMMQEDWRAYGADAFEFVILENFDDVSIMREREQYWIDQSLKEGWELYNAHPASNAPFA